MKITRQHQHGTHTSKQQIQEWPDIGSIETNVNARRLSCLAHVARMDNGTQPNKIAIRVRRNCTEILGSSFPFGSYRNIIKMNVWKTE